MVFHGFPWDSNRKCHGFPMDFSWHQLRQVQPRIQAVGGYSYCAGCYHMFMSCIHDYIYMYRKQHKYSYTMM
jgi:hypothetical protein